MVVFVAEACAYSSCLLSCLQKPLVTHSFSALLCFVQTFHPPFQHPLARQREADVDTLAAAIENRTTIPSQLDTVLPQENRLQRNPFLDAAAYVRAGNVERGPKPAQPSKADVKRDQLKKCVGLFERARACACL